MQMPALGESRGRGLIPQEERLRALRGIWIAVFFASSVVLLHAQDLAPRAYVITPLHSNAVTLTYGFYSGSLILNGAVPVNNTIGTYSVPVLTYYHSFGLLGRSANISASIPYAIGTFEGRSLAQTRRSTAPVLWT
jgi:hypothetical protein